MKYSFYLLTLISLFYSSLSFSQEGTSKKIFYDDGVIAKHYWYTKNLDSIKTYYPTGELWETFYYNDQNKYNGICRSYNKNGEIITTWLFDNGKLLKRTDLKKIFTSKNKELVLEKYKRLENLNDQISTSLVEKKRFSINLQIQRAYLRAQLGNKILALNDFSKLKNLYEKLKKRTQSKKDNTHLLSVNKGLASVYDVLGSIYATYEQEEQAIHYKYLAIKTQPKNNRLLYNLGSYLVAKKEIKLGIHYLNKVLEKAPKHTFANWSMGIAQTDKGNYTLAQKYISVARKSEFGLYKFGRGTAERDLDTMEGYIQHKLGNTDNGIMFLMKALDTKESNSFAKRYLGEIYLDLENYNLACDYLNEAKELGYQKMYDRDDLQPLIDQACDRVVDTTQKELDVFASPNPVIYFTEIQNFPKNFNYILFDYEQRKVKSGKAVGNTLNLSSLQSGLYILQIENNGVVKTLKIIKH